MCLHNLDLIIYAKKVTKHNTAFEIGLNKLWIIENSTSFQAFFRKTRKLHQKYFLLKMLFGVCLFKINRICDGVFSYLP